MELIEQFTLGKIDGYSEDRLIVSESAIGVIDGARGLDYQSSDLLVEILRQAVDYIQRITPSLDAIDFTEQLSRLTQHAKTAQNVHELPSTGGFFFCIYFPHRREIWRIGDCVFALDGESSTNDVPSEAHLSNARQTFIQSWIALQPDAGRRADTVASQSIIPPLLRTQYGLMNNADHPLGFGAITGQDVPEKFIQTFHVPKGTMVEISSDGYPRLCGTLQNSETHLSEMLRIDPLAIAENKGPKGLIDGQVSYDDRTYVRFIT